MPDPADKRALENLGGDTRVSGDADEGARLAKILESTDASPEVAESYTHAFHAYPARMHAAIARAVLAAYATPGDHVLDPFCGSGTVLIESMVAGMRARGVDLNPLAVRVAAVKCQRRRPEARERFARTVLAIGEASKQRVKERAPSRAPLSAEECQHFDAHVLKELAGLYEEIKGVEVVADRAALQMLLSAIVVKFSRQRSETSSNTAPKRIGKYVPSSFFQRKGEELVRRWEELDQACGQLELSFKPKIVEGDATALEGSLPPSYQAHLVLSSPPYGGTYDYVDHHARRYPWLGISTKAFSNGELGARRNLAVGRDVMSRWDDEVTSMLRPMAKIIGIEGQCVLLVGDGEVGGHRVSAAKQLQRLAPSADLRVVAWASQKRQDWHGGADRAEHLVLLRKG